MVFDSAIIHCNKLLTRKVCMNTVKILNSGDVVELPEQYNFEKVIPILVNKEIYLARMQNNFLNE